MKKLAILIAAVMPGLLVACNKPDVSTPPEEQPAAKETVADNTLAQVGLQTITQRQYQARLRQLDEEDFTFAQTPLGKQNFLQLLVRERLAVLDAQRKNLDKSDEYISALEDKRAELKAIYQTYAQDLLIRLWEEQLQSSGVTQVTPEEIDAYYKKYPYEMKVKQIIIQDPQTAETVWRELKHNKNRWKELERKYSVASQATKEKEFAFMPGEFIPELEVVVANSPTGSVQGFIKTSQGFHIIMKTAERRLSLQEAAPRIRQVLENQKIDALLQNLQTKYKVVIYE